jgi:hypothetical protein
VYYREIDDVFVRTFSQELENAGYTSRDLLAGALPRERKAKPWSGIDMGVSEVFLAQQWEQARAGIDRGYCAGTVEREGVCLACGACDTEERKQTIRAQPAPAAITAQEFRAAISRARTDERLMHFRVTVHARAAGLPRKIVGVAIGRALMLADDRLVEGYRGCRGSFLSNTTHTDWVAGHEIITLAWNRESEDLVRAAVEEEAGRSRINDAMNGYGAVAGLAQGPTATFRSYVFESPFPFDPADYFKNAVLKYTSRKTGENAYRFDFSRESLKRKVIAGLSVERTADAWMVVVEPGPKFQVEMFMRSAFRLGSPEEWVRIAARAVVEE